MTEDALRLAMTRSARETMRALIQAEMIDRTGTGPTRKGGGRPRKHDRSAEDYKACCDQGMTRQQTAKALGVSEAAVDYMTKVHKLPFRDARRKA